MLEMLEFLDYTFSTNVLAFRFYIGCILFKVDVRGGGIMLDFSRDASCEQASLIVIF